MSQALFELYKEALRRGHVAAVQGRLEAALAAYEAASTIAPDRALPHASLGDVLGRLGRPADAEHAYDAALQRAPMDEAALRGRAAARLQLERPVDAARDLEALADVLERANRIPEACEAACSALELGETRNRRLAVERLVTALAGLAGGIGVAAALARAEPFLDPSHPRRSPDSSPVTTQEPAPSEAMGRGQERATELPAEAMSAPAAPEESAVAAEVPHEPMAAEPEAAQAAPSEPEAAQPAGAKPEADALTEPAPLAPAAADAPAEPEPGPGEPEPERAGLDAEPARDALEPEPEPDLARDSLEPEPEPEAAPSAIDVVAARVDAERLLAAGEPGQARGLLLQIAAAERAAGRLDAALDACLILVAIDPADVAVQVELAEIQAARGWTDVARDKLALLTRMADLDGNAEALALIERSAVARELASVRPEGLEPAAHS